MGWQRLLTAIGGGVTTCLLSAVAVIELLDTEFSAIIGVPIGLLFGVAFAVAASVTLNDQPAEVRRLAAGYAAFGLAVLAVYGLQYAHLSPISFTGRQLAGLGALVSVVVYIGLRRADRLVD